MLSPVSMLCRHAIGHLIHGQECNDGLLHLTQRPESCSHVPKYGPQVLQVPCFQGAKPPTGLGRMCTPGWNAFLSSG